MMDVHSTFLYLSYTYEVSQRKLFVVSVYVRTCTCQSTDV